RTFVPGRASLDSHDAHRVQDGSTGLFPREPQTAVARSPTMIHRVPLIVAFSSAVFALRPASAAPLEVGQRFPDLVLPSLAGEPLSISSFRGKKLIVHIFASW
ncbi:MAG: TlpA family protein disulfide reductase, partial [Phycisphaerae bacterium]